MNRNFSLNFGGAKKEPEKKEETVTEKKFKEITGKLNIIKTSGQEFVNVTVDDMEFIRTLGSGAYGHVTQQKFKKTQQNMAVKCMRRSGDPDEDKRIMTDCYVILETHTHPNIVNCYGIISHECSVYICMEVMTTCLHDLIYNYLKKGIDEIYVGKLLVGILDGLAYLKSKNYMHRDVKPSNMLINYDGIVKLCDFGISGQLIDSQITSAGKGTLSYLAPERIESVTTYDARSDVWSLGITIIEMIRGEHPYAGVNCNFDLLTKIKEEPAPFFEEHEASYELRNFVSKCLEKNVSKRAKYNQLLEHYFIQTFRGRNVDVGDWITSVLVD
uniref:mitogen-activated protein kinase kinase n=1 Tax=Parastrongyloides trichosuri TaxID=131310 RepID=A0A0N4Z3L4_PARTI